MIPLFFESIENTRSHVRMYDNDYISSLKEDVKSEDEDERDEAETELAELRQDFVSDLDNLIYYTDYYNQNYKNKFEDEIISEETMEEIDQLRIKLSSLIKLIDA